MPTIVTRPPAPADVQEEEEEDLPPARTVSLARAVVATVALMFLTGAVVYVAAEASDGPSPNAVDVGFYDDMQAHHNQGITIALAYVEDGTDPVLRQMAEEVVRVQAGEVRLMGQAVQDWGENDVDQETAMEWMGMPVPQLEQPGMASDSELERLDRAEGAALDDLFSRLMIVHHRGGEHMAAFAADRGSESSVRRLAESMVITQRSEVAELNLYRETIGLAPV